MKAGTQDESNPRIEYDHRHAMMGGRLPLEGRSMGVFGPMAASMKKVRLEGPVFGEVHPGAVLVVPAAVPSLRITGAGRGCSGKVLVQSHSWRGMRGTLS